MRSVLKKGVLLVLVVSLLSISAFASSFDVESEIVENSILLEGVSQFKIKVTNNFDMKEEFKIKNLDYPVWDINTAPLLNPIQFSVLPNQTGEIDLFVTPLHVSNYGVYDVSISVEAMKNEQKIKKQLRVNIVSPEAGTYVETVLVNIFMEDNIDPTEDIPIRITLDNQNTIEYPDLLVEIESNLIKEKIQESLDKKEKKTITLTKSLSPQTTAQEDTVVVRLVSNNKTLDTKIKKIEVIEHKEIKKEEKITKKFLKIEEEIILKNVGNVRFEEGIKIESSFIQNLFSSSTPKGFFIKEDEKRYLVVEVDIPPGEEIHIVVVKNYITLLIIVLLLAGILALYYVLRSPLTLRKTATNIRFKEGGVSELKVVLNVRNRGNNKLKDIEIMDKIPNIANLEKGVTIGTLHPTKILKHEHKGTMIKWLVDE
ncbi:MAG: hypothetical protein U9O94_08305, partial [Nanoarchaeota archaeon]|nr:hypothetical protein [Nanoarchaeota archaeon]